MTHRERTHVHLPLKARDLPGRIATGGYIMHSGIDKWNSDAARAQALHRMAADAFPVLKAIPPERFLRMLAAGEIALGSALLAAAASPIAARAADPRVRDTPPTLR
jgi:uncharacterized membrane protein YphA (DoxX/SURF4 family)